ncbi:MAG: toll/interleukin-1 receptor domain-containing protein [Xenococcus sp. MO_188.B8]|nr:toll/interleukin-1 receptor domain-containing protein [Xenococcus sp. MO_188.B8]
MKKAIPYRIYIIHQEQKHFLQLKEKIEDLWKQLPLKSYPLEIVENPSETILITDKQFSIGLYIATFESKKSESCKKSMELLINNRVDIVPLVKDIEQANELIPATLRKVNALSLNNSYSFKSVAITLILRLLTTYEKRKLFISYSRKDSAKLADQIWEALSKRGFQVFLDLYSIQQGVVDFQERIETELSNMDFLLLIESPNALQSKWVEYEILFALKQRMGLLSLSWPDVLRPNSPLSRDLLNHRFEIEKSEFHKPDNTVSSSQLEEIISKIEFFHANAILRRLRNLMSGVIYELEARNVDWNFEKVTSLIIKNNTALDHYYYLNFVPRIPDVYDLFKLDTWKSSETIKPQNKILFHTKLPIQENKENLLDWVRKFRKSQMYDEDFLLYKLNEILGGSSNDE